VASGGTDSAERGAAIRAARREETHRKDLSARRMAVGVEEGRVGRVRGVWEGERGGMDGEAGLSGRWARLTKEMARAQRKRTAVDGKVTLHRSVACRQRMGRKESVSMCCESHRGGGPPAQFNENKG
jgi:hypothetical protein